MNFRHLTWIIAIAILVISNSSVFAKDVKVAAASPTDSDRVDLKSLEQKYWSAKDSDYSVIQNRLYPKENRFYGALSYGPLMNDSYSIGRMTNFAAGYYFSERLAVEFAYEGGTLSDNDGVTKYRDQYAVQVDYNRFIDAKTLMAIFVPLYAKMSFLDKAILYFDMQVAMGIGQVTYDMRQNIGDERASATHFELDLSQQIFFHRNFALRLDIKNKFYEQQRRRYQVTAGQDRNLGNSRAMDTTILLGLTGFLW